MQGSIPRFSVFCFWSLLFASGIHEVAAEIPDTWIDDAQLHDVQLVGSKLAIAVGEHGAVLKSEDGGRTWKRLSCGFDVSLRSVCFLTDQIGWIAGGDIGPFSASDGGVLLSTRDGGKTWQRLGRETLPALRYVKFFELEEGVVVGQPTPLSPSGIFKTSDAGQTWRGVQGDASQSWKAMSFVQPELGAVAGVNGRVSLMGGEQIFASKLLPQGTRSIRAIHLSLKDVGWLAGDGGLVLKTTGGGVVWESPPTPLPEELREAMDFRAVEVRGEKVWLAGSPGSVIWHSPDGGKRWTKQLTGQTAPLSALRFCNEQQGTAVGALGVIVRTDVAGKTWQAVRGDGRRAALLAMHSRPSQTTAPLIAKLSGEQGYRSAVWIAQRNDLGPLAVTSDSEAQLQSAVHKSGGNAAEVYWQLPQSIPGLENSSDKLVAEWQKQTEGRLPQTLLGGMVRQIRTWKPSIIVLDQPSPDDAVGQLIYDAAIRAVEQAADETRYLEQSELLGLGPWNVDRIYVRLAAGANGDTHVDLDEFLPYLKTSTRIAASSSDSLIHSGRVPSSETVEATRIAYRWLGLDGTSAKGSSVEKSKSGKTVSVSRDFFGGQWINPGTAARREMSPLDEASMTRTQKLIEKQRNFTAFAQRSLDDPRVSGQMLGQINNIVEGMDARQAAIVLKDLADEYRKRSQFEMVEATLMELVSRYPSEIESLEAARWLIQFWCSSETTWQRSRTMQSNSSIVQTKYENKAQFVQQAVGSTILGDDGTRSAVGPAERTETVTNSTAGTPSRMKVNLAIDEDHSPDKKTKKPGRLKITREVDWRTGAISEWHSRANELAKKLNKTSPNLYRSPEIQFPLASLRRRTGTNQSADAIMRNFVSSPLNAETKELAERELWTSYPSMEAPNALAICRSVSGRPHLDGLLSDPCWEDAREIHLTESPIPSNAEAVPADSTNSMVMFAYDSEFMYVAIKVPRVAGTSRDEPQMKGRLHDADLSRHDHVSIRLDIDRDYTTWYEFQVDQRGWTAESCWEDWRWNPTWYVAVEADKVDWRIEAAIPWNELTPVPPQPGTIYGISILRTMPTVGLQSWTHPVTTRPKPASFGMLKFE